MMFPVRRITAKPATVLTLVGVLFWTPGTEMLGFGVRAADWIAALVLLLPFAYCAVRLFRAPLGRATWPVALVSLMLGLVGVLGLVLSLASGYLSWHEPVGAVTVCACLVFAARNWMVLRVSK